MRGVQSLTRFYVLKIIDAMKAKCSFLKFEQVVVRYLKSEQTLLLLLFAF